LPQGLWWCLKERIVGKKAGLKLRMGIFGTMATGWGKMGFQLLPLSLPYSRFAPYIYP